MAPRGKRKPSTKAPNTLLEALQFVANAQRGAGAVEVTHCRLFGGYAMASNSILSAAHALTEDIQAAPHTYTLVEALEQAPGPVNLSLIDAERLSVRSGDFQALVPCIDPSVLPVVSPDAAVALCDGRLKAALEIVGTLIVEGAEKIVNASVQMRSNSVVSSNGNVILEAWHGVDMPPLQIVPKTFITALSKIKKTITRFGCSTDSFTVWFEDNSWLKTQLYPGTTELPDLDKFLNVPTNPVPVPKGLFEVAKRLEPFSKDGVIHFTAEGARVNNGDNYATDLFKNMPVGLSFSIKSLLSIAPYAKTIHFNASDGITLFFNDTVRGAIVNKIAGTN